MALKVSKLFTHISYIGSKLAMNTSTFVNVLKEGRYSIVEMNRKPVNSLNLEMLTELAEVVENLENDPTCEGMILSSAFPNIFSAGLDIKEFLKGDEDRLTQFWGKFQNLWMKLYGCNLATIAAVNGAAPAAGCLLAISCDHTIMADGAVIGPNETKLGIVAPRWFIDTIVNTVGHRQTEQLLFLGKLLTSSDACKIGLVNEVVKKDDLLSQAKQEMAKWLSIPGEARIITKRMLRHSTIENLLANRNIDTKQFIEFTCKESTQKMIAMYMKELSMKSKS